VKSENSEDSSGSDEEEDEEPPVPMFGDAVSSYEALMPYFCSYKIDEVSLSGLEYLERESCSSSHLTNEAGITPRFLF
jgi:hypothetical protein